MLSKSKSLSGAPGSISGPKKKKAPPRPPPPSNSKIQTSQSFRTASELISQQKRTSFGQTHSYSTDRPNASGRSDLIDFATPPGSPESAKRTLDKPKGPPDYMYRVGASVFYIKSQLKNSTSDKKIENPFSPPRPTAQSLLSTPVKFSSVQHNHTLYSNVPSVAASANNYSSTGTASSTVPSNTSTSYQNVTTAATANASTAKYKPTIIKRPNENNNNNSIKLGLGGGGNLNNAGGSFRSSSGSSDWSDYSQQSQSQQQPRYGNVPMPTWDEPPAQNLPKASSVVLPTIIKPPTATKPSLLPKPNLSATHRLSTGNASGVAEQSVPSGDATVTDGAWQSRNYYDDPPDSDFDDDDDFNDDSVVSPPMPSDPPPPPPPDLAVDEWVDSTKGAPTYHESVYDNQGAETDRAYAIALYDYIPDAEGDLPLQAGDLVYLTRRIDDAWLFGICAGVEGMFPSTYVNVVVPLPDQDAFNPSNSNLGQQADQAVPEYSENPSANVLYQFDAEAEGDLSLQVGDVVTLYWRVNDDWLYGEMNGSYGQFPATFVTPVPSDLPTIPKTIPTGS